MRFGDDLWKRFSYIANSNTLQNFAFMRFLERESHTARHLATPLIQLPVVVFDLETTGFHPQQGDEIISIGAVKFNGLGGEGVETFYTLVQPNRDIPAPITALTGIQPEDVLEAPSLTNAIQTFMQFAENRILVAHYARHDKRFLEEALWKTCRVKLYHRIIDTVFVFRALFPEETNDTLESLLARFDLPLRQRHHALSDAQMAADLWKVGLRQVMDKGAVSFEDFYHIIA